MTLGALVMALVARASIDPVGVWPLSPTPVIVAPFEPPDSPYGAGHRGVDLAGRVGSWVRTALPGRVVFAGRVGGIDVVVVSHGRTRTTYQPVAGVAPVGSVVAAGDVLGLLEATGSHCAPAACLHWGWRRGERYLDPLRLVGAERQLRLLPWAGSAAPDAPPAIAVLPLPWADWRPLADRWRQALG
jgi:murein DD-endopeptidase MepM/ murein hydrolase activator NlpD